MPQARIVILIDLTHIHSMANCNLVEFFCANEHYQLLTACFQFNNSSKKFQQLFMTSQVPMKKNLMKKCLILSLWKQEVRKKNSSIVKQVLVLAVFASYKYLQE